MIRVETVADRSTTREYPGITILVPIHGRIRFLRRAIDSILLSDVSREDFEILVVGRFESPELEKFLGSTRARYLRTDADPLGAKLAVGIREARFDHIAFLEDDDEFLPAKLGRLRELFAANPSLGYYHNSYELIDAEGQAYPGRYYRASALRKIRQLGEITLSGAWNAADLRVLAGVFPEHVNSCISVRREVVAPQLPQLARLNGGVDEMLFLSALASGWGIRVDDSILTRFRLHPESYSNPLNISRLDSLLRFSREDRDLRPTLAEVAQRSGRPYLIRLAAAADSVQRAVGLLREAESDRRAMRAAVSEMRRLRDTYVVRSYRGLRALAILYLTSPALARLLYRWIRLGL